MTLGCDFGPRKTTFWAPFSDEAEDDWQKRSAYPAEPLPACKVRHMRVRKQLHAPGLLACSPLACPTVARMFVSCSHERICSHFSHTHTLMLGVLRRWSLAAPSPHPR